MEKTTITIEKFKNTLGELYPLVEVIWAKICKDGFCVEPQEKLGRKEIPIDECTQLEKILLACIAYIEDGQEKIMLMQYLLLLMYQNHPITQGRKVEIRRSFIIVVVN